MFGMYKVYENGKLIAEQKNKLTLLGRSNALSTMLGLTQSFAGSFGIGISSLSNGSETYLNMTDLDFNVGKYPITATSLGTSGTEDALVYTARITDPSRYSIHELGLFSNQISGSVDVDALTLLNFEAGDAIKETVSSVDYYLDDPDSTFIASKKSTVLTDSINYRIGSNAVSLLNGATIFANDTTVDLSSFYNADSIKLAFYAPGPITVTVKFLSGANYASYSFVATNAGYFVSSKLKTQTSAVSATAVDWSLIDRIDITTSGGSNTVTAVTTTSPSAGFATYTSVGHAFIAGDTVTITGSSVAGYNGTYTITSVANKANATVTGAAPGSPAAGSVRYTTQSAHTFAIGDIVTVSGSDIAGYNGTFRITGVASTTFDVVNATIGTEVWTSGLATVKTFTATNATTGAATWTSGLVKTPYAILDGLRIAKDKPIDSIDGMVSRAVLSTPISKEAGSIIDIEYLLVFSMDVT